MRTTIYKPLTYAIVEVLCSQIINGTVPLVHQKHVIAGKLFALEKDPGEGNVRPVAIGEAIRRMAARCVCYQDSALFTDNFKSSLQFGVGVQGGVEFVGA